MGSESYSEHGLRRYAEESGQTVNEYRFVKQSSAAATILHAGAGEGSSVLGVTGKDTTVVSPDEWCVKALNEDGTFLIEMASSGAANDKVYVAADGKGTTTAAGAAVAVLLQAASGSGSIVEARPVTQAESGGSGNGQYDEIFLGELNFATVADGNLRTGYKMPFAGRIKEFYCHVKEACVGSGGTILVNLEKGGTNLTGGVITFSTAEANVLGERLEGTAITDNSGNLCAKGDLIDVEGASAGGTRTSGAIELYALVQRV